MSDGIPTDFCLSWGSHPILVTMFLENGVCSGVTTPWATEVHQDPVSSDGTFISVF